ncbi:hypothetical protein [Prauserella halophila]|nr:hypothetical protein [Prauserella halophila]
MIAAAFVIAVVLPFTPLPPLPRLILLWSQVAAALYVIVFVEPGSLWWLAVIGPGTAIALVFAISETRLRFRAADASTRP